MKKVGMAVVMQNPGRRQPDHQVYREERKLADLCEPMGFDSFWSVEHHFDDYMIIPDVLQFLTYMAGRTTRVQLGTAVKVLPWHDPVKVAEAVAMLDILSDGRVLLGVGRGSAKSEFDGLRIPMEDSRERFQECSEVLVKALGQESFSYQGKFFQIPELSIRPRPFKSFEGRIFGAAVSPASAEIIAKMGFGLLVIPQRPWDETAADLKRHQAIRTSMNLAPISPITMCWVYVGENEAEARTSARRYMGNYWESADAHYGLSAGQHENVKGYEFYKGVGQLARKATPSDVLDNYINYQVSGTAEACVQKIRFIEEKLGCDHFIAVFKYGGMSLEAGEKNLRRFCTEVMPKIRTR